MILSDRPYGAYDDSVWRSRILILSFATITVSAFAVSVQAQTRWLPPRNFDSITLEVLKPAFESSDVSFLSLVSVVTAQVGVGKQKRTFLTVDVPLSRLSVDGGDSKTAIGNPYVGVVSFDANNPVVYELGVRIPIASNNTGNLTGLVADFDRFEAYAPDNFSASAALNYFPSRSGDWVLQTRVGPTFLLNTDPGEFDAAADLYVNYGLLTWYFAGAFQGGLGLSGRLLLTDSGSLGERIVHQIAATAQFNLKHIVPGVHIRMPLDDDLSNVVDLVFGLSVVAPI